MARTFLDRVSNKALGELLLEKAIVTNEQFEQGLETARRDSIRLGEALVRLGFITHDILSWALGEQFGLRPMEIDPAEIDIDLVQRFPADLLVKYGILPVIEMEDEVVVVVGDPNDIEGLAKFAELLPDSQLLVQLADPAKIRRCLDSPALARWRRTAGVSTETSERQTPSGVMPESVSSKLVMPSQSGSPDDLATWLVGIALKNPDGDLILRTEGSTAKVLRHRLPMCGVDGNIITPYEECHAFPAAGFAAVRDALLRRCEIVPYTNGSVANFSKPLRFGGSNFGLQIAMEETPAFPAMLRIRPLRIGIAEGDALPAAAEVAQSMKPADVTESFKPQILEPFSSTLILYESITAMERFLREIVLMQAGSHVAILMQGASRRAQFDLPAYPSPQTEPSAAADAHAASLVIFDHPVSTDTIQRVRLATLEVPAVAMFAPVVIATNPCPGPEGDGATPSQKAVGASPHACNFVKVLSPEVIWLSPDGTASKVSAPRALEFLGGKA